MSILTKFREENPAYKDWSDEELAYGLYSKFYKESKPLIGYAKELGFDKNQTLSFMKYASDRGDKLEFNTEPSVGGKIVGAVRGGLQGMTFGAGDEIVAGGAAAAKKMLQGDDRAIGDIYEQELQRERGRIGQFREDEPTLAYGSEIIGGIAVPLGATKTLKGAFGSGAALGGVSAAAASEGDIYDRLLAIPVGAAMGAILGGTFQVAGKTISDNLRDYMSKKAQQAASEGAQSVQSLKQEATSAYQEAYKQGVKISPEEFMNFLTDTIDKASGGGARGVSKSLTPKSAGVLKEMEDELFRLAKDGIGLDDMDYFRQLANTPAADFANPNEQRIAGIIQGGIDDFIGNLTPDQLAAGDAKVAVDALKKARQTWSQMRKTAKVEEILQNAKTYAGGLESGLRNQISNILRDPKKRKQFSRDEVSLLTQIREGTPLGNLIGNIAQAGYSLTGGRNVFGGGLAGAGGVVGAAVGATVGDGLTGAAIGVLLEQAATTGIKYIREMAMENRVKLFRDIVANNLASEVQKANPGAYRLLEAAAKAAEIGAPAATRAGIVASDEAAGITTR
jgi:hypothetical protein